MDKRPLKDSPIDLNKLVTAAKCLEDLKFELSGIEETEEALENISKDILSLTQKLVQGVEKLVSCVFFLFYAVMINGATESGVLRHVI